MNLYGDYQLYLNAVMNDFVRTLQHHHQMLLDTSGTELYDHLTYRVKDEASMRDKCHRKDIEATPYNALRVMHDAIGVRIICRFIDEIYTNLTLIRSLEYVRIVAEKDYIQKAKSNGYRSYHLILQVETPYPDIEGHQRGWYYVEVQLRTIAMDTWASLEHEMKYKKNIRNQELIESELKRCADVLASCDLSMQTIRHLIQAGG